MCGCKICGIGGDYSKMRLAVLSLFDGLKHGDVDHQRWLKNFIINHFNDLMGAASPFAPHERADPEDK